MDKYEILETLGGGAFGIVYKSKNTKTSEIVAIKEFKKKFFNFEECKALREVKSLSILNDNENIIKIKEMIFKEDKTLLLVFNYMKENLYEMMKARINRKFSEGQIKCVMFQILKGLAYIHTHKFGFFHRDLKPENILVDGEQIKIADFGLAREIRSVPPYTDYVSTRWYRAPECLLKSTTYNTPVDIWALGCIMVELYNLKPIFPGNSEKEVLYKICSTLGVPGSTSPNITSLAKRIEFKFPQNIVCPNLSTIVPEASKEALELISLMLQWDPSNRASANTLLNHPYFTKNIIPLKLASPEKEKFTGGGKKFVSTIQKPDRKDTNKDDDDDEFNKILENTQDFDRCKIKFNFSY